MPGVGFIRPAGGGSVSVELSDTTPKLGQSVTITGTASGYTPDSYLFFAYDGTSEVYFIAEQASNSFDWQILGLNAGNYTIYVLGVENGSPDVTAFDSVDITLSVDFLLDQTYGQDIDVAFAFYKVRAAFNDYVAIIRRDSDNAQDSWKLDSNGVLSLSSPNVAGTTTLGDWIGSDNGYLVTWKDQSTAGLTATNSNATTQAQIIALGSMVTLNGVASLDKNLWRAYVISSNIIVKSAFTIGKNESIDQDVYHSIAGSSFANNSLYYSANGFQNRDGIGWASGNNNIYTGVDDTNPHLASFILDEGIYVDGQLEANATSSVSITINSIGAFNQSTTRPFRGKICSLFFSSQYLGTERTDIEANINNNFTPSLLP